MSCNHQHIAPKTQKHFHPGNREGRETPLAFFDSLDHLRQRVLIHRGHGIPTNLLHQRANRLVLNMQPLPRRRLKHIAQPNLFGRKLQLRSAIGTLCAAQSAPPYAAAEVVRTITALSFNASAIADEVCIAPGSLASTANTRTLNLNRPLCAMQKATTPSRSFPPPTAQHFSPVNILFVGDVFGSAGRHIVREHLPHVLETNAVDLLVINGENAAGGFGITPSIAEELFDLGAHVITTGNHIWDKKEIFEYMTVPADSHARPPRSAPRQLRRRHARLWRLPGRARQRPAVRRHQPSGPRLHVLLRRPLPQSRRAPQPDHRKGHPARPPRRATSEKVALGWYLDGRITALLGTHTHIPTADERILPTAPPTRPTSACPAPTTPSSASKRSLF